MNYDPYYLAMTQMGNSTPQMQDIGGLSPVFQNIAQQQANQNMVMQQGQGLTQAAGQTGQGGGMNPMMMAALLRKQDPTKPAPVTDKSQMMPSYSGPSYGTNPNFSNSHFDTMSYD
jgi:hypothetical protein